MTKPRRALSFSRRHIPFLVVPAACLSVVCLLPARARAQTGVGTAGTAAAQLHPAIPDVMRWRSVGPYRGGRSVAVAGDPSNRLVFYFGATGGGV